MDASTNTNRVRSRPQTWWLLGNKYKPVRCKIIIPLVFKCIFPLFFVIEYAPDWGYPKKVELARCGHKWPPLLLVLMSIPGHYKGHNGAQFTKMLHLFQESSPKPAAVTSLQTARLLACSPSGVHLNKKFHSMCRSTAPFPSKILGERHLLRLWVRCLECSLGFNHAFCEPHLRPPVCATTYDLQFRMPWSVAGALGDQFSSCL